MSVVHRQLTILTKGRGTHEFTDNIRDFVDAARIQNGLAVAFCQHTSCSLVIMENADPTARHDLEEYFNRVARDADPVYRHSAEGPDDMSAHIRMALTRTSETIPIIDGRLALGTWQGIYLFEHRTQPHNRRITITLFE